MRSLVSWLPVAAPIQCKTGAASSVAKSKAQRLDGPYKGDRVHIPCRAYTIGYDIWPPKFIVYLVLKEARCNKVPPSTSFEVLTRLGGGARVTSLTEIGPESQIPEPEEGGRWSVSDTGI